MDGMLPFGLRSAPKLFTAVADALEWCIHKRGVESIFHYLDDFIVMAPPGSVIANAVWICWSVNARPWEFH